MPSVTAPPPPVHYIPVSSWDFTHTALMLYRVTETTWNSGYSIYMFSSLSSHIHTHSLACSLSYTRTHRHIVDYIQPRAKPLSHGPPTPHLHSSLFALNALVAHCTINKKNTNNLEHFKMHLSSVFASTNMNLTLTLVYLQSALN